MLKKTAAILIIFALCFSFAACNKNDNEDHSTTAVSGVPEESTTENTERGTNLVITSEDTTANTTRNYERTIPSTSALYKDTVSLSDIRHNPKKYQGAIVTAIFRVSQVSIDKTSYILDDSLGENYLNGVKISFEYPKRVIESMKDGELIKVRGMYYDGYIERAEIIDRGEKLNKEHDKQVQENIKYEAQYLPELSEGLKDGIDENAIYKASITITDKDEGTATYQGKNINFKVYNSTDNSKLKNGKTYNVCCAGSSEDATPFIFILNIL